LAGCFYPLLTEHTAAALASGKSSTNFGRNRTWSDFWKMAGFWICQSQSQNLVQPTQDVQYWCKKWQMNI